MSLTIANDPPRSKRRGDPQQARRLRRLREDAGFNSAAAAAHATGLKLATYHHYENGFRPVTERAARQIAKVFGVPPAVILFGERLQVSAQVNIVGSLGHHGLVDPAFSNKEREGLSMSARGAEATIAWFAHPHDAKGTQTTTAPPGVAREAARMLGVIRVDTQDLMPLFALGDELFYRPGRIGHYEPSKVHGRRCFVQTPGGQAYVRVVSCNSDGSLTLLALGPLPSLTIANPTMVWPILWTKHQDPDEIV